ncbi:MAG TPA: hypothetical protein VN722_10185 [Hanamia sp.]|nr:hypothetical protein [Hanamia sp.]
MKLFRIILWIQSIYYFLTAAWGLFDIQSFMQLTGPKTDVWLVKTVSLLLLAISFSFIANLFTKTHPLPVAILAIACCLFLAAIDFYYSTKKIISFIYAIDGIIEIILLSFWIVIIFKIKNQIRITENIFYK